MASPILTTFIPEKLTQRGGCDMKPMVPSVEGNGAARAASAQSVADILERDLEPTIRDWMASVEGTGANPHPAEL